MKQSHVLGSVLTVLLLSITGILWFVHGESKAPKQSIAKAPSVNSAITLQGASFSDLPGWATAKTLKSLQTFLLSCQRLALLKPEHPVGNQWLRLQAKDWQGACDAALQLNPLSDQQAKTFFETWFQPKLFVQAHELTGLFTGYYAPQITASLNKTADYPTPIYGVPKNLLTLTLSDFDPALPARQLYGRLDHRRLVPYYSRAEIDQGAIAQDAPVLAYVHNTIERLFLEIQGSGMLTLTDGRELHLAYAGKNGLAYTPIGKVLIQRGILNHRTVSKQSIEAYLGAHPAERDDIIHHNRSFVFFKIINEPGAYGTQGAKLTPGYSLAVDPNWVPLGIPLWLHTTRPDPESEIDHPFNRLMVAQDTGGAIKGAVRGDVFWGDTERAAAIAGKMKHQGQYWLLVPKQSQ